MFYVLQLVSGLVSFLYPGVAARHRETLLPYHVFFGISNFVLAVATVVLGFCEKIIFSLYVLFIIDAVKCFKRFFLNFTIFTGKNNTNNSRQKVSLQTF